MIAAILNPADALEASNQTSLTKSIGSHFSSLMLLEDHEEIHAPQLSTATGAPAQSVRPEFGGLFIK